MRLDLDALPDDASLLQLLVRDLVADMERRDGEIEKLRLIIKQLQRSQFGRRSEKLAPDQLALGFEDLDADIGRAEERHAGARGLLDIMHDVLARQVLGQLALRRAVLRRRRMRSTRRDAGTQSSISLTVSPIACSVPRQPGQAVSWTLCVTS
jgi:Transposase C of IS166 homeodomain